MRSKNKIISLLLCAFMVFTLIPFPAMAAEGEFVDEGSGLKFNVLSEDLDENTGTVEVSGNSYGETSYTIPETVSHDSITYTVTGIGQEAFQNCADLISVSIPDSVTDIGDNAFSGCTSLESVNIPDDVTGIGIEVFLDCQSLTSVIIPDSVTSISYGMFSGCTSLDSVNIPDYVTWIGNFAFTGCGSLTSISIPEGVTEIGISAFSGTGLSSVTIPGSVIEVWDHAFRECEDLTEVIFLGITPPHFNAFIFDGAAVQTVTVPMGTEVSYGFALSGKLPPGADIYPAEATIMEVLVSPDTAEVEKGSSLTFSSTVDGTGSFSQAVTWSVDGGTGTTIYDGALTVSTSEPAETLTVKATSVADTGVYGEAIVTVLSSTSEEQFDLPAGSTCYFDLSGAAVDEGEINTDLPDNSLKWVPFTYVGTIEAYSLDESANGSTTASETAGANPSNRSLFVADHNACVDATWNELNDAGLIFGNSYTANGIAYLLRSLSAGNGKDDSYQVIPKSNEWDQILIKGDFIKNHSGMFSWGQDTYKQNELRRICRGYYFSSFWFDRFTTFHDPAFGFRPALEILNADMLSADALKTVTYDMGADGTLGNSDLTSATVIYTDELTLPEITKSNGFNYTGTPSESEVLGWHYYSAFYPAGTRLSSLPSGAVLTAGYGVPAQNSLPKRKAGIAATATANVTVNTRYTLNLAAIFEDMDSDPLTYKVSVNGAGEITADEDYSYTPASAGITTLVFRAYDGTADSEDTYTVTLTANSTYTDDSDDDEGNSGSGNSRGGSGGSGNSNSASSSSSGDAVVSGGGSTRTTLHVNLNINTGNATVDIGALKGNLFTAGGNTVITMPSSSQANNYTVEMPKAFLSGQQGEGVLTLSTNAGSITMPGNMLSGVNGDKAGITIGQYDKSGLPEDVKAAIGDRPLVQLTLTVDGKQTEWSNPDAPVTVSVLYTPTAAELADPEHITVWYIDGSGKAVSIPSGRYDAATGKVTFSTTHFSNYAVVYVTKAFNDLGSAAWAKNPIEVLASKGILKGVSEKEYAPQKNITRAEFLYFLVRTLGIDARVEGNFDDISKGAYYYKEIGIAKKLGITGGIGNNSFNPDESISRQDMMVMTENALRIAKKLKVQETASSLDKFADRSLIAAYAISSVDFAVKEGLIVGSSDKLNPLGNTTRAEAAVFLYRLYNKFIL